LQFFHQTGLSHASLRRQNDVRAPVDLLTQKRDVVFAPPKVGASDMVATSGFERS
jgi:hypothetical protein